MGKDPEYLNLLYHTLERFDAYLWKVRDSDGDGCLESWCKYDTGEDHAMRYGDAPDAWTEEVPPEGCQVVPMASMDFMSFSYSSRETLAEIEKILGNTEREKKWRDQAESLTYQRAIRAFENYGYEWIIPILGRKFFEAIGEACVFVQQYDPFTMKPSAVSLEGEQDAYGPAMLSVLEYTARMYGVHIERDQIYWGSVSGIESTYEQIWGDHAYKIVNHGTGAEAFVDGKKVFEAGANQKIITDLRGNKLAVRSFERP